MASLEEPITQRREVHLLCGGKTVCVATSAVTITTPLCERLFLDEKFAIGQMFRRMQMPPQFALLECGGRLEDSKRVLWRRYTLSTEGFECDITEVFPDRDMFVLGEQWLSRELVSSSQESSRREQEDIYCQRCSHLCLVGRQTLVRHQCETAAQCGSPHEQSGASSLISTP